MVRHMCTQYRPAQPRPIHQRNIHRFDVGDTFRHKMHRLAPQGGRQPVGDMPHRLLFQSDGDRTQPPINLLRNRQDRIIGSKQFDQWDQVWRVEGMGGDQPLGMPHLHRQM